VIISWSVVLFFSGFYNPLPWSVQNTKDYMIDDPNNQGQKMLNPNALLKNKNCDNTDPNKPGENLYITEEYFYRDILHTYNEDCTVYDTSTTMGQGTTFQWQIFLS
jgi:hypothetical protein